MATEKTTKEIKARIKSLESAIAPLQCELDGLRKQLLEMASPFKVGDVITWNGGKRRGRVVEIGEWCCGEPCWFVRSIRKDGSEGKKAKVRPYNIEEGDGRV